MNALGLGLRGCAAVGEVDSVAAAVDDVVVVGGDYDESATGGDVEYEADGALFPVVVEFCGEFVGEQHGGVDGLARGRWRRVAVGRRRVLRRGGQRPRRVRRVAARWLRVGELRWPGAGLVGRPVVVPRRFRLR